MKNYEKCKYDERKVYPRRGLKNNKLQLRISDDELDTLNSISLEDDESISQVVRKAIRAYERQRRGEIS